MHLGSLPPLCAVAFVFASPSLDGGGFLGLGEEQWFSLTLLAPILHQVYVWLGWRSQLAWQVFSRCFGRRDLTAFGVVFVPLLLSRPVLTLGCGLADRGSAGLPPWASWVLGLGCLLPALYALHGAHRYFGPARAMGGDHFRGGYRDLPFVERGAFAWTPNAMYALGFLGLWGIALLTDSRVALATAFFQHAFIWAHYAGTEKPDMRMIYGKRS